MKTIRVAFKPRPHFRAQSHSDTPNGYSLYTDDMTIVHGVSTVIGRQCVTVLSLPDAVQLATKLLAGLPPLVVKNDPETLKALEELNRTLATLNRYLEV